MHLEKTFKRAIILSVLLMLLSILIEIFMPTYKIDENAPINAVDVISILWLIIWFYNMFLLFKFKSFGKAIYVPVICFSYGIAFTLPLEIPVSTNYFSYLVASGSSLLTGVIVTFIYFTDIKSKFEN